MVETGLAELPTVEKEWSPRNSHCQMVEKQGGGRTRVNTLDLFSLLPSSFLQVSLISQIYPENRAFPGAQEERDWIGGGRSEKRPSAGRGSVQEHQEEQASSSIWLPLELVVNYLMLSTA